MLWIGLSILLAGLWGIFITLYFTVQHFKSPWRWPLGILSGILVGLFMSYIDFMILWPPVNLMSTITGIALISLISFIAILGIKLPGIPKLPPFHGKLKGKNENAGNNIIYLNRYQRLRRIIQKNSHHKHSRLRQLS